MENPEINFENQPKVEKEKKSPSKTGEIVSGVREKLSYIIRHRSLNVKEYFGRLDQEEFDEILSFDFRAHLQENHPIGETFSPQKELSKIRSLPRKEKRGAIDVFKQRLAIQRKAWGQCRRFIERSIDFNHDVPRDKLIDLVDQFGLPYGFTEEQRQIAGQLIDGYYENRKKALEVRQRYPGDIELIDKLIGVNLGKSENVHVAVGPMTIDIDVNSFNSGRLYERSEKPVIGFKSGGFASCSSGENPIYYTVTNQDRWTRWVGYLDPSGEKTRNHEHEHQKNKLFQAVFEHQLGEGKDNHLYLEYEEEQDLKVKKTILEDYFCSKRAEALEQAKDEITASLYDRSLPGLRLQLSGLFFKQDSPYDYLAYLRNFEPKKEDSLYQETSQKILVQEYGVTIKKAVKALSRLTKKRKYSTQEAIALLTDKSLSDWPKTIDRLLEQK